MAQILSRPIRIAGVGSAGSRLTVRASPEELVALAEANGLEAVESFEATLGLEREGAAGLRVGGTLAAAVVYRCVVTLEPVPGRIVEPVAMRFRDAPEDPLAGGEMSLDAEDPPEPAPGGIADIGALLAEFFTLALDPYPRAPGAELPAGVAAGAPESPFAALARLKGKGEAG